jgi:hypothetical protein
VSRPGSWSEARKYETKRRRDAKIGDRRQETDSPHFHEKRRELLFSRERSELSIFLITLHAPLSTILKRTLDNAFSRLLPTPYNEQRLLLPAKRNWRDAVVLAPRSVTGEGEAFTGCFCPQPTAVLTAHRIPSPKIGLRFPVALPAEPFSIIHHN